jgi:Family of unknown function (DUF6155)
MAKSKITDLKKILEEMTQDELKLEILKLYNKLPQVKDFYNQDLMTEEERQEVLKKYKEKIYREFWTSKGKPKGMVNNSTIKNIISDYEKICLFAFDLVDLLIYRVEITTEYAEQFGGMAESNYNSAITTFKKAMKIIQENNFLSHFENRCKIILKAGNLDYWYIEQLEHLFYENGHDK